MSKLKNVLDSNAEWAKQISDADPGFFEELSRGQAPEVLWIGCADSRVPPTQLMGMVPGEAFVHRNIANVVVHTDTNSLSVLQYAVQVLKVRHVIVCGHYACGGVAAALSTPPSGIIANWLQHIKDVAAAHQDELDAIDDDDARRDRLVELNVRRQVQNVASSHIVQRAWQSGQELSVHGLVYSLKDGLLKDLDICLEGPEQLAPVFRLND
jgi:carbonic anhydrase